MIASKRRAKIIATLGPACSEKQQIKALLEAGADVLRVNTSHLDPEEAEELYKRIDGLRSELASPFALLVDLAGPKLRLSSSVKHQRLETGQLVKLSEYPGKDRLTVRLPGFTKVAAEGGEIVLGDGYPTLRIEKVKSNVVKARVVRAGYVRPRIGIALPGTPIELPALTPADKQHVEQAAPYADWFAQSFVGKPKDVKKLSKLLSRLGSPARIAAKIERFSALGDIDRIIDNADAIMLARGDLGVEIGLAAVPFEQQRIISACRAKAKPSITATQVLDSMSIADLPTRAEASDVAQALVQGTSALMLSGETATGDHPRLTVEVMSQLITKAEAHLSLKPQAPPEGAHGSASLVRAADQLAFEQQIKVVIIPTTSGNTARLAAALGRQHVIALCTDPKVERQLCLERGVTPVSWDGDHGTYLPLTAIRRATQAGVLRPGRRVVVAWAFNDGNQDMHLIAALSGPA